MSKSQPTRLKILRLIYEDSTDHIKIDMINYRCKSNSIVFHFQDLEITFDNSTPLLIGQDAMVRMTVKNTTDKPKDVSLMLVLRSCSYFDHSNGKEKLMKEEWMIECIQPGKDRHILISTKV